MLKKTCVVTKGECEKILSGDVAWIKEEENRPLLQEFCDAYNCMQMRPKTIVSYKRQALIYNPGNVRITFDMDISSGLYHTDFLDTEIVRMPVLPGKMIMEVKYDEYLPDIVRLLIQSNDTRVGAFSKYAACRSYE